MVRKRRIGLGTFLFICAFTLTACANNQDMDETHFSLISTTEDMIEGYNESTAGDGNDSKVPRYESVDKDKVAERVLLSIKNQCLEWYYSDYHHVIRNDDGSEKVLDYKPGTSLYYQVWGNEKGTAYQIKWSDDELFATYYLDTFEYLLVEDHIKNKDNQANFNQLISDGKFVVPDQIMKGDPLSYVYIDEEFEKKWKDWFVNKFSSEWNASFANAYLMPYYVEEDGSADLIIYLEDENGFYLMVRAEVKAYETWVGEYPIISLNSSSNGDYGVIGWKWLSEDERLFQELYYPNSTEYGIYRHVYFPDRDGYNSYCFEEVSGDYNLKISNGNDFIKSIPKMAERLLPIVGP